MKYGFNQIGDFLVYREWAPCAKEVYLYGDFNNWDIEAGTMEKLKNGTFKALLEMPKDATYEFKYVVDGEFVNEPEADSQVWNDFAGAENSVLSL